MPLETLENGKSFLEQRTKINEAVDEINSITDGTISGDIPVTATGTTTPRTLSTLFSDIGVTPYQFGALGGGADDTTALQSWLNSPYKCIAVEDEFIFTSDLFIPDNKTLDLDYRMTLKKQGNVGIKNAGFPSYGSGITINNLNYTQASTSSTNRGYMLQIFCDNLKIENLRIRNIAEQSATGAWSGYVSGKNVQISNPDIDSTAGEIFADGLHFGYLEDTLIYGGTINAGDDALAFYFPSSSTAEIGRNQASKNVKVYGMNLGSSDAHIIRIGALHDSGSGTKAPANCVWDGLTIDDITDISVPNIGTSGRRIVITDLRPASDINGQHSVSISNVSSNLATSEGSIRIAGNPDYTDVANINQKNFKKVVLDNVDMVNTDIGANMIAGGIEYLSISESTFKREVISAFKAFEFYQIDDLEITNSSKLITGPAGTTGTAMPCKWVKNFKVESSSIIGGGEFAMLNIDTNSDQDTNITIRNSFLGGAQRTLTNNNAAVAVNDLKISCTEFDASVTDINPNILNFTSGYVEKSKELATSDGSTGASTTPNGTVKLTVNGIDYFVLTSATA